MRDYYTPVEHRKEKREIEISKKNSFTLFISSSESAELIHILGREFSHASHDGSRATFYCWVEFYGLNVSSFC